MKQVAHRYLAPLLVLLGLLALVPSVGQAQSEPNRAGLVILHGDGQVVSACVSFGEPEITGLELIERAGLSFQAQTNGGGAAVCKLDGEGCDYPAEDCFCKCKGAECVYWAYQHLNGGAWSYSRLGASATKVKPGAVEGWAWGAGSVQNGAQPPLLSFEQICAPPGDQPPAVPTTALQPSEIPTTAPEPPTAAPIAQPTLPPPTTVAAAPTAVSVAPSAAPTLAAPTDRPTELPTAAQATAAPSRSAAPTAAAAAPTVTSAPSATLELARVVTPTPALAGGARNTLNYLAFGGILLFLVISIVVVLLRGRRARRSAS